MSSTDHRRTLAKLFYDELEQLGFRRLGRVATLRLYAKICLGKDSPYLSENQNPVKSGITYLMQILCNGNLTQVEIASFFFVSVPSLVKWYRRISVEERDLIDLYLSSPYLVLENYAFPR